MNDEETRLMCKFAAEIREVDADYRSRIYEICDQHQLADRSFVSQMASDRGVHWRPAIEFDQDNHVGSLI